MVVVDRRGVSKQTRATLLAALRTRDHSEDHGARRIPQGTKTHDTGTKRHTQMKRQAERGARNSKTTDRLSGGTVGSHCRHRHRESVPHITPVAPRGPLALRRTRAVNFPARGILGARHGHGWGRGDEPVRVSELPSQLLTRPTLTGRLD